MAIAVSCCILRYHFWGSPGWSPFFKAPDLPARRPLPPAGAANAPDPETDLTSGPGGDPWNYITGE